MARELISRKKDARLVNINVTFPFEFELISSWMEFLEGRERLARLKNLSGGR